MHNYTEDSTITIDLNNGRWLLAPKKGISHEQGVRVADSVLPGYDIPALIKRENESEVDREMVSPRLAVAVLLTIVTLLLATAVAITLIVAG